MSCAYYFLLCWQIWDLADAKQGSLSRSSLYKALALVAWAQQGKQPSTKLLENFSGEGKCWQHNCCFVFCFIQLQKSN